ncbi:MAG: STAS domain-containing protein [Nocardioidaceae bacterium]|nr:STAS domain-containing protein [Nocardioidaceae bacterium]
MSPGSHLCAFYGDDEELSRVATAFVTAGLATGARVLYVAADHAVRGLGAALALRGVVDLDSAVDAGQLVLRDSAAVYGTGETDLATLAAAIGAESGEARRSGFTALRVAAEMTPFAEALGSAERLLQWERAASRMQQQSGVSSVCQYDERRLPQQDLRRLEVEHTGSAPAALTSPAAHFLATREPWGLRVVGQVDLENADELLAAVRARCAVDPRVFVDMRELTFIDVGATRELVALAAGLPADGTLFLVRPPAVLARILDLAFVRHQGLELVT